MLNSILWQWSKDQGYTIEELAEALGYRSSRYVEQVIRGWSPVTDKFIGRFVVTFPKYAEIFIKHAHIFIDAPGGES